MPSFRRPPHSVSPPRRRGSAYRQTHRIAPIRVCGANLDAPCRPPALPLESRTPCRTPKSAPKRASDSDRIAFTPHMRCATRIPHPPPASCFAASDRADPLSLFPEITEPQRRRRLALPAADDARYDQNDDGHEIGYHLDRFTPCEADVDIVGQEIQYAEHDRAEYCQLGRHTVKMTSATAIQP